MDFYLKRKENKWSNREIERESNLVVDKNKEIFRDILEFLVDWAENGGDSSFDGSDGRSQRPWILLRVVVEIRHAHKRLNRSNPHKPKTLQLLLTLPLTLTLRKQTPFTQISYQSIMNQISHKQKQEADYCKPGWWPLFCLCVGTCSLLVTTIWAGLCSPERL